MKIVKDNEGYFIVDDRHQKVNLMFESKKVWKVPTIMHLGLTYWHSNEKNNIISTPFEVIIDNITHFKSIRFYILQYLIDKE